MKTVQIVLDQKTLTLADRAAKREGLNRSALIRKAIAEYAGRQRELALERKHRAGYQAFPVSHDEVEAWETLQAWPEK